MNKKASMVKKGIRMIGAGRMVMILLLVGGIGIRVKGQVGIGDFRIRSGDARWPNYVYTGDTVKPPLLRVEKDGVVLKEGENYVLSYTNCVNAHKGKDSATVEALGVGLFGGIIYANYRITTQPIGDTALVKIRAVKRATWTGDSIRPEMSVMFREKPLRRDTDYRVDYINNKNIGKATYTITGLGNFSGQIKDTFAIIRNIFDSGMVVPSIAVQTWTDSAVTPAVVINDTLRHVVLQKDVDYTVSFADNVNVGWATMFIEGKGYYSGVGVLRFLIYFNAAHTPLPQIRLNANNTLATMLPGASGKLTDYFGRGGIGIANFLDAMQQAFNDRRGSTVKLLDDMDKYLVRYRNSDTTVRRLIGDIEPYLQHIVRDEYELKFALFPTAIAANRSAEWGDVEGGEGGGDVGDVGNGVPIVYPPYATVPVNNIFYYTGTGFRFGMNFYNASGLINYQGALNQVAQQFATAFNNIVDNGWRFVRVAGFNNDWLVVDIRVWPECPSMGFNGFTQKQIEKAQRLLETLREQHAEQLAGEQATETGAAETFATATGGALSSTEVVGQSPAGAVAFGVGVVIMGVDIALSIHYGKKKYPIEEKWVRVDDITYTGDSLKPTVTVKTTSGYELRNNSDYIVEYRDNVNTWDSARAVVFGRGGYNDSVVKHFTINRAVFGLNFRKLYTQPRPWTGGEIRPEKDSIIVRNAANKVVDTSEYKITGYENNVNVSASDSPAMVKLDANDNARRRNYSDATSDVHAKFAIHAEIIAFVEEYKGHYPEDTVRLYKGNATGTDTMAITFVQKALANLESGHVSDTIVISDTNLLRGNDTYRLVIARPAHLSATIYNIKVGNSSVDLRQHSNPDLNPIVLPCGDVNGDTIINLEDSILIEICRGGSGSKPVEEGNKQDNLCDLNGDDWINETDIKLWQKFYDTGKTLPLHLDFNSTGTGSGGADGEDLLTRKSLADTGAVNVAKPVASAADPLIHRADGLEIAVPIESLVIYDANGQTVYSANNAGSRRIPLPKGAYLVYLNGATYRYVQ